MGSNPTVTATKNPRVSSGLFRLSSRLGCSRPEPGVMILKTQSERLIEQARSHFQLDEIPQCAFLASSEPPKQNHAVVVTNQGIHLFSVDVFGRLESHIRTLGRQTALGPFEGWLWSDLFRKPAQFYVSRRYRAELDFADSFLDAKPEPRYPSSPNKHRRASARVFAVRSLFAWSNGTEFDFLAVLSFVLTNPWRLYRLMRLALRVASVPRRIYLSRVLVAILLDFVVWVGAILLAAGLVTLIWLLVSNG